MDFNSKIRILDGGLGSTMLKSITEPTDEIKTFPELLTLDRPSLLYDVHTEYIKAGADIISTNTFSANEISLRQIDREDIVIKTVMSRVFGANNFILCFRTLNYVLVVIRKNQCSQWQSDNHAHQSQKATPNG